MSDNQKPKKPRARSKKLKINKKEQWQQILKEIEADNAPIKCLDAIQVNLRDGTTVIIDIQQLLSEGTDPEVVEYLIDAKLKSLDSIIHDVDFCISVDLVAKAIQPITDSVLKDL